MSSSFYCGAVSKYSGDRYTPTELRLKHAFLSPANRAQFLATPADANAVAALMDETFTRNVNRITTLEAMNEAFANAYRAKQESDRRSNEIAYQKFHVRSNIPSNFLPRSARVDDDARFHTIEDRRL